MCLCKSLAEQELRIYLKHSLRPPTSDKVEYRHNVIIAQNVISPDPERFVGTSSWKQTKVRQGAAETGC